MSSQEEERRTRAARHRKYANYGLFEEDYENLDEETLDELLEEDELGEEESEPNHAQDFGQDENEDEFYVLETDDDEQEQDDEMVDINQERSSSTSSFIATTTMREGRPRTCKPTQLILDFHDDSDESDGGEYQEDENASDNDEPMRGVVEEGIEAAEALESSAQQRLEDEMAVLEAGYHPLTTDLLKEQFVVDQNRYKYEEKYGSEPPPCGVKVDKLPPGFEQMTPADWFKFWFTPIITLIKEQTDDYCKENKVCSRNSTKEVTYKVLEAKLWNWLNLWFASGLTTRTSFKKFYSNQKLYGCDYFKETMSYGQFVFINRIVHCDSDMLLDRVNRLVKLYYSPSKELAPDDDSWKYTGRCKRGMKKKNDKKQAKTGIISWKLTDKNRIAYHTISESSKRIRNKVTNEYKLSSVLFDELISALPDGQCFTLVIDAGTLSTPRNILIAISKGHEILASTRMNNPSAPFKNYFHKWVTRHQTKVLYGPRYLVASFNAGQKSGGGTKWFNVITNIRNLGLPAVIKRWDKAQRQYVNITSIAAIPQYNKLHGFTDQAKAMIVSVQTPLRSRGAFRAQMKDYKYTHAFAGYKIYTLAKGLTLTFEEFMAQALPNARYLPHGYSPVTAHQALASPSHRSSTTVASSTTPIEAASLLLSMAIPPTLNEQGELIKIKFHHLKLGETQRRCAVCGDKTKYRCSICTHNSKASKDPHVPLCNDGLCQIKFHNPNAIFVEAPKSK
jgi:hypothetical protein